jgi:4'-phosphopantetheinyl transferase
VEAVAPLRCTGRTFLTKQEHDHREAVVLDLYVDTSPEAAATEPTLDPPVAASPVFPAAADVRRTSADPGRPSRQRRDAGTTMARMDTTAVGSTRWLARGEHELPAAEEWLTPGEAGRAASMRFTKRRSEFLLRRWVGKHAVAAACGLPTDLPDLARIEVANRRSGAPCVLVDGALLGLDVSLTDRAGWAVCLVGADLSRVGCDLEIVEPRSAGFVADFLTPREQAYVASLPLADEHTATNLIWSAKESALKVLRTGLRRDTRSVEVVLELPVSNGAADHGQTTWGPLEIRTAESGVLPGWWRRYGVFLLTVAAERPLPAPEPMADSANLVAAQPVHSWLSRPFAG